MKKYVALISLMISLSSFAGDSENQSVTNTAQDQGIEKPRYEYGNKHNGQPHLNFGKVMNHYSGHGSYYTYPHQISGDNYYSQYKGVLLILPRDIKERRNHILNNSRN